MVDEPFESDYDYLMTLWAGQVALDRAVETMKRMLEGLR